MSVNGPKYHSREHMYLSRRLDGILFQHTFLKQLNDLLTFTISFTVSQVISSELQSFRSLVDKNWWPLIATVLVFVIALLLSLLVSNALAHKDRAREIARDHLKEYEDQLARGR